MPVKKAPVANWKVRFYYQPHDEAGNDYQLQHVTHGRRYAVEAWRLYWGMRGKQHIYQLELWQGKKRIL